MLGLSKASRTNTTAPTSHLGVNGFDYSLTRTPDAIIKAASKLPDMGKATSQAVIGAQKAVSDAKVNLQHTEELAELLSELAGIALETKQVHQKHNESIAKINQKSIDVDVKHTKFALQDQLKAGQKATDVQQYAKSFNDRFTANTSRIAQRIGVL